jgi:hypothetical protein
VTKTRHIAIKRFASALRANAFVSKQLMAFDLIPTIEKLLRG